MDLLPVAPQTLALFLAATLALNLTPGPDMIYVLANGLRGGFRGGLAAAGGIVLGAGGHVALAVLGLTALLAALPWALDALRIGGGLYLLWLGWKALTGPSPLGAAMADTAEAAGHGRRGALPVVRDGFVTCILNPKVGLFFLAFLPQFVDHRPEAAPVVAQILFLGAVFLVSSFVTLLPVAAAGGGMTRLLRRFPRAGAMLGKVSGVIFIALALRLLLMGGGSAGKPAAA